MNMIAARTPLQQTKSLLPTNSKADAKLKSFYNAIQLTNYPPSKRLLPIQHLPRHNKQAHRSRPAQSSQHTHDLAQSIPLDVENSISSLAIASIMETIDTLHIVSVQIATDQNV